MELKMMKKPVATKAPAEQVVKDIRRATRKLHSSEEKIRIVLSGHLTDRPLGFCCIRTPTDYSVPMTQSFGPFTFDPDRRSLTRGGQSTELGQRASALLAALLAAGGHPVSKATLMDAVWPDTTVEEGNLTVQISVLRKSLGLGPSGVEYIITMPRVGYRLVQPTAAAEPEGSPRPALAVMPFANLSGDVGQDYFADGVVEDIIIALSKFRSFAVIARNSTFAYRGRSPSVPQVATELGVLYVLEGSVRRMGDHIRITAQLVDGKTGSNFWAQNFDGATADIFDVQDQITASVAAVVGTKIELAEIDRSRRKRPGNLDAYDYYLRALQKLYTYLDTDNLAAITLLHQAIALEPDFALALAWAAYGYEHRVTMGWDAASPDDGAKALNWPAPRLRWPAMIQSFCRAAALSCKPSGASMIRVCRLFCGR